MNVSTAGRIESKPDYQETNESSGWMENTMERALWHAFENGDSKKRIFDGLSTPSPCFSIPSTPFLSNSDFINKFETTANSFYASCGALNAADLSEFIFDQNGTMIGAL